MLQTVWKFQMSLSQGLLKQRKTSRMFSCSPRRVLASEVSGGFSDTGFCRCDEIVLSFERSGFQRKEIPYATVVQISTNFFKITIRITSYFCRIGCILTQSYLPRINTGEVIIVTVSCVSCMYCHHSLVDTGNLFLFQETVLRSLTIRPVPHMCYNV